MASVGGTGEVGKVSLKSGEVRFRFEWWNWVTISNEDGTETRHRDKHPETKKTAAEAETLRKAIIATHSRGELWVPGSERPVARLKDIAIAYASAAENDRTARFRMSTMNRFCSWVSPNATVAILNRNTLVSYAEFLRAEGLKTRDRYIGEVEAMWDWAHRRDTPGVSQPRRIVGDDIKRPPPVFAVATPNWDDCDTMIAELAGWHRQVAIVLRYTGLRASQVLTLDRSDIDLDAAVLRLRADAKGAKGTGRHRAVPIHAALVKTFRAWTLPKTGRIFESNDSRRENGPGEWREDALVNPFKRAWQAAKVAEVKWGAPTDDAGGRVHARPTHAFRSAFKSGLLRAGVSQVIADILIGHKVNATQEAYVPHSEYWKLMEDALAKVPAIQINGSHDGA